MSLDEAKRTAELANHIGEQARRADLRYAYHNHDFELAEQDGGGDVAGGADFAPTEAQLESLRALEGERASVEADLRQILQTDLPAFNQSLVHANLTPLLGP